MPRITLNRIRNNPGLLDFAYENRKKYIAYSSLFYSIFGIPLFKFWDNLFGFDIIKFDEEFIKSDTEHSGKSTADVVLEKFGEEGLRLIKLLLK